MKNPHAAVVTATVGAHLGYLAYLPSGGFPASRRPRTVWLHVAAASARSRFAAGRIRSLADRADTLVVLMKDAGR